MLGCGRTQSREPRILFITVKVSLRSGGYVACRGAGSNSQNQPWSRTTHQWTRPQESFIKCNKVGIGIFLRDENISVLSWAMAIERCPLLSD
ncbi:hypothetical protein QL285_087653 [Trifolium repens]|nr:hypothetical protein QL285_087653 [Trifolium repens]